MSVLCVLLLPVCCVCVVCECVVWDEDVLVCVCVYLVVSYRTAENVTAHVGPYQ